MKKKLFSLLLVPVLLTGCGKVGVSEEAMLEHISKIEHEAANPYYHVIGMIDFNNEITEVDAVFDKEPGVNKFVPYARYNEGYYIGNVVNDNESAADTLINGVASRSYFLRAPLHIDKDNYYAIKSDSKINTSCAQYQLEHIVTSYIDDGGSANPSSCYMYYEILEDGGFAFGGNAVHTIVKIDNYPYYPDYNAHEDLVDGWDLYAREEAGEQIDWDLYEGKLIMDDTNPLPCFKNTLNAKVNIRFEYNKDGWLVKESLTTINYNYNVATQSQCSLYSVYSYRFGA